MKITIVDHPRKLTPEHYNDVVNAPLAASLNSGYAYSVAASLGHELSYHDFLSHPDSIENMSETILTTSPQIILIHWVYTWDDAALMSLLIKKIRAKDYSGIIGAFGQFPTFVSTELLRRNQGLDLIFIGEFEASLWHYLKNHNCQTELLPIPGLLTRYGNGGRHNLVENLDQLPFPKDLGKTARLAFVNIAASRGCANNCSFCCIKPYYDHSKWRSRTVHSLKQELENRLNGNQNNQVYFVDANFFGYGQNKKKRVLEISRLMSDFSCDFGFEARANDIDADTIEKLKHRGLQSVFLGVESASMPVLKRMQKNITPEISAQAIKIIQSQNIFLSVGFIMFEPDSTMDDLYLNYDFLLRNGLLEHHDSTANLLYHNQIVLKGTPVYDYFSSQGRLKCNPKLPYEGEILFKDPGVALVKDAMGKLSYCYFSNIDKIYRSKGVSETEQFEQCHHITPQHIDKQKINHLLVNAFLRFLDLGQRHQLQQLNEFVQQYCGDLESLFS